MKRLAALPLLCLALGCGGASESSSSKDRPEVEHKVKPPVHVQPPAAPDGAVDYEPAAMVIWIGTDGVAVSDSLELSGDEQSVLRLAGGHLTNAKDKAPTLLPEVFEALQPKVETFKAQRTGSENEAPIAAALVVDRRVDAQTLLSVAYSAGQAEIGTLHPVFDYDAKPKMVTLRSHRLSAGESTTFTVEMREGASSLLVGGSSTKLVSLGDEACTFDAPAALNAPIETLCGLSDNELELSIRPHESGSFADLAPMLAHSPWPEGCEGNWTFGMPHDTAAPKCDDAVAAKDAIGRRFDPDMAARQAGILGLMAAEADNTAPLGLIGTSDDDVGIGGIGLGGAIGDDDAVGFGIGTEKADVKVSGVSSDGDLGKSLMMRIVRAHRHELGLCAGKDNLATGSKLQLKAKVSTRGTVIFAYTNDDGGHADTATCMTKAVKKWKFPKPKEINEIVFDVVVE